MTNRMGPAVTPSALQHAERLRTDVAGKPVAGQSTAQHYAARILPGYVRDEELREQARKNELRARGVWTPDAEEEVDDTAEDHEEEVLDDQDDDEEPVSTAERYARIERERQAAERKANARAQASMVRSTGQPLAPQRPPIVGQPHRYAHLWEKPAS